MPSARLELAQLSPLPPQDSVSTNFTTTAAEFLYQKHYEDALGHVLPTDLEFTLKSPQFRRGQGTFHPNYLAGICAAPEAGACAGVATTGA